MCIELGVGEGYVMLFENGVGGLLYSAGGGELLSGVARSAELIINT